MAYHIAADVPSKIGKFFSKRDDIERATLDFPHINSLALIEPGLEPETTPNFFKPWAAGQPESLAVIDSQDEILAYHERLIPPSNSVGTPFFRLSRYCPRPVPSDIGPSDVEKKSLWIAKRRI